MTSTDLGNPYNDANSYHRRRPTGQPLGDKALRVVLRSFLLIPIGCITYAAMYPYFPILAAVFGLLVSVIFVAHTIAAMIYGCMSILGYGKHNGSSSLFCGFLAMVLSSPLFLFCILVIVNRGDRSTPPPKDNANYSFANEIEPIVDPCDAALATSQLAPAAHEPQPPEIDQHQLKTISLDEIKPLTITNAWNVGDRFEFVRFTNRKKTVSGRETVDIWSRTPITIEVLGKSGEVFFVAWTHGNVEMRGLGTEHELVKKIARLTSGQTMILEVDSNANVVGVRNWEKVQQVFIKVSELVIEERRKQGKSDRLLTVIAQNANSLYSTREKIEALATKEPRGFLATVGRTYNITEPTIEECQPHNQITGTSMGFRNEFSLAHFSNDGRNATIRWKSTFDSTDVQQGVQSLFDGVAKSAKEQDGATKKGTLPTVDVVSEGISVVDHVTGWPVSVRSTTTTTAGPSDRQTDLIVFQRAKAKTSQRPGVTPQNAPLEIAAVEAGK